MSITFERFTRDSPRNDDILARGGPTRDLIYHYRVLRDGEHIATFRRDGNSYELYDRIGRAVVRPGRNWSTHIGEKCPNKEAFEAMIQELSDVIPTAEQCEAWQESERQREKSEQIAAERAAQLARVREAAPQLLKRLQWSVAFIEAYAGEHAGEAAPELAACRQLMADLTYGPPAAQSAS